MMKAIKPSADATRSKPLPDRFQVARSTLMFDRFMNNFVIIGGISVILAVSFIFVFIMAQIWPLFRSARVSEVQSVQLGDSEYVAMGVDEYMELPFFVTSDGGVYFYDLKAAESGGNLEGFKAEARLPENIHYRVAGFNPLTNQILLGTEDGRFSIIEIRYRPTYTDNGRQLVPELKASPLLEIGKEVLPEILAYGDSGARKAAVALQRVNGKPELHAVTLVQEQTLFGSGETRVGNWYDLTEFIQGNPIKVMLSWEADSVIIAYDDGNVDYLPYQNGHFTRRQRFTPFADLPNPEIASMDFVLGDVSIVFTSQDGEMRGWSLFWDPESEQRIYGPSKTFSSLSGAASFFSPSARNKAFLTGRDNYASLCYLTTEAVRWESALPFSVKLAAIAPRYNGLLFLDQNNVLHIYSLDDPHPEAGWKSFFGKVQYEGQAKPTWMWQSTGGRDDFERKLSMIPLIVGTLKGTLYAMIFATPVALLAALYTSQFLSPAIKRYIKPTMEIMASLPSVVLGFLAALWLAPIVSNDVPAILTAGLFVVLVTMGMGFVWERIPVGLRCKVPAGYEFLILTGPILLSAWAGWELGREIERMFFVVTDPESGLRIADFRLWSPQAFNLPFEQRNAFVVGFVMGFAVIPIIFTISEDALSNVPESFRSASLALGASRWQTAIRVVFPTASSGIFSALMIGLGRAVGETMIVVMATGNVAVTDLNPFTGMRTLSANIAVELPEAPYLGTLYRTLFLGAMLLFLFTFIINTVAEVMRQHLRERYRAVE